MPFSQYLLLNIQHDLRSFMLDSEIIWRLIKASALKIASYILACCNIKDKTWLQIAHNIDTQNYLQNCHFIGAKTSEHNEKVMVSSHDVGSNCAPFNGVAQVTVRLVLPFALSVCHGCTKLSCLLRWYILKKVRIPSRLVTNVMSTSHVVCINTKDR